MSTQVSRSVIVNVPVSRAYNQWTQFEDFPQFMGGVQKVTQLSDDRLEWVAQIFGVKRQWEARILQQVPDQKVAWAATSGATNAGAVSFEDLGGDQCRVTLELEYGPEGLVEKAGDALNIVERQAESDLEKFKTFIESEGYATGAWRGTVGGARPVGTPGVADASGSQGDSGKAGISGKAVAAGVGVAAAATAAVVVGSKGGSQGKDKDKDTAADARSAAAASRDRDAVTGPGAESADVTPPDRFSTAGVGGSAGGDAYASPDLGIGRESGMDVDYDASQEDDMPLLADDDKPLSDTGSRETMTGDDGAGRAPQ